MPIKMYLPDSARQEWQNELVRYKGGFNTDDDFTHFLVQTRKLAVCYLPDEFQKVLNNTQKDWISPPYIHIQNLPTDKIDKVPTPSDGYLSRLKSTVIAESVQLGICQLLGQPYAFQKERREAGIIHVIAPRKGEETALTSENSEINLGWHVEHSFSTALRPSFVTLFCLRPDRERQAATGLVDIRNVIPHLSRKTLDLLCEPIYMFKIPDSFGVSGSVSKPMPIIGGDFAKPELSFGLESKMVVACDDPIKLSSVNHALQELRLAFNRSDLQYQIYLDKGEFLVINNHVTVHGRSVFKVHEDGYNRWLQRTIVRQSLYEARSMQGSRYCQYA